MRARLWPTLRACLVLLLFGGLIHRDAEIFAATDATHRQTEIVVAYTQFEWWLMRWSDNKLMCQVFTDSASLPTPNEVEVYCGTTISQQWQNTQACSELDAKAPDLSECAGFYFHFITSEPKERTILVELPIPQVWITLDGCEAIPLENICQRLPTLILTAEEPLPNEMITAINGVFGGEPFSCPGEICAIPLKVTPLDGATLEFWADSSYGDSSQQYSAQVRVVDTGLTQDPSQLGWFVDILSTQWLGGEPIASCAQNWLSFPPIGGVASWLANPADAEELFSTEPYHFLAGKLISSGVVDASDCPAGGLLENGWANPCGLERARDIVDTWQNQFDEEIIQAAQDAGIPSQLLKNLFAQESQFWPASLQEAKIQEFSFGRLTELGADTVLLWNPEFFAQFCPLMLHESTCARGYAQLEKNEQALLRGALVVTINADCPDCEAGIDLTYTGFSIGLFAQILAANCEQTGQIIHNLAQLPAGDVASYEDLWRFSLVNYHGGPGCLSTALSSTWQTNVRLTWSNVIPNLELVCQSAILFVDRIAVVEPDAPPPMTETPPTPTPEATPTSVPSTPLPTQTGGPYPYPGPPTPIPTTPAYP